MANIIGDVKPVPHPRDENVFLKHFFGSQDNDRLNNLEVTFLQGAQISLHTHDKSSEFFYVVRGGGDFFVDGAWHSIKKGDAIKAPMGMEHGIKCKGDVPLVLFSTFRPAAR